MFVKGYGFFFCFVFCWKYAKNVSKNIGNNLSGTYGEELLDHTKKPATDAFKIVSKRAISKKIQKQLMIWYVMKLLLGL